MKTFGRPPDTFRKNETTHGASNGFLEEEESPITHVPAESWLLGIFFSQNFENQKNKMQTLR